MESKFNLRGAPSVDAAWRSYMANILPRNASSTHLKETHLAFYAGASILFYAMLNMLDPGAEPTEADLKKMSALDDEIGAFARTFDAAVLQRTQFDTQQ